MSADHAVRTARWRRWASSVPGLVALLFATTTVAADAGSAGASRRALLAVQASAASMQHGVGAPTDVPVLVKRGGSWTAAPDAGSAAWLPARGGGVPVAWLPVRPAAGERGGNAPWETYQVRGPPGTA